MLPRARSRSPTSSLSVLVACTSSLPSATRAAATTPLLMFATMRRCVSHENTSAPITASRPMPASTLPAVVAVASSSLPTLAARLETWPVTETSVAFIAL